MSLSQLFAAAVTAAVLTPSAIAGGLNLSLAQQGNKHMNLGDYDSAVRVLMQAARKSPSDLEIRRHLCSALLGAGKAGSALEQLRAIRTVSILDERDLTMTAEAYYQLGKSKTALAYYKEALKMNPESTASRLGVARTLIELRELNRAEAFCLESIKTSRDAVFKEQMLEILNTIKNQSTNGAIEELKS